MANFKKTDPPVYNVIQHGAGRWHSLSRLDSHYLPETFDGVLYRIAALFSLFPAGRQAAMTILSQVQKRALKSTIDSKTPKIAMMPALCALSLSKLYRHNREWALAKKQCELAYIIFEALFGPQHPLVLIVEHRQSVIERQAQGQL